MSTNIAVIIALIAISAPAASVSVSASVVDSGAGCSLHVAVENTGATDVHVVLSAPPVGAGLDLGVLEPGEVRSGGFGSTDCSAIADANIALTASS